MENMLTPAVKKKETIDAILAAVNRPEGCSVQQIEEIAAAHGDTITWLLPASSADLSKDCNA